MQNRPYNFGAGPSMLPEAVLIQAQKELLNWQGSGMSVMEVGARTGYVHDLFQEVEQDFRKLLKIPHDYKVLFLPCPARTLFSTIPLNLVNEGQSAAYIISGVWSEMAFDEGSRLVKTTCIARNDPKRAVESPKIEPSILSNTAYAYFTPNETINGICMQRPHLGSAVPIVADMTSCILTEPLEMRDYGLIFAGAQKNISIPGLTVVVLDPKVLKDRKDSGLPFMDDFWNHIDAQSVFATPPVFNLYLAGLMFKWVSNQGGVAEMHKANQKKSDLLYQFIDNSKLYECSIATESRSLVNVCFKLNNPSLETMFLEKAEKEGLLALKGHRLLGGIRASLYNAMPIEGVKALIDYMARFSKEHGYGV